MMILKCYTIEDTNRNSAILSFHIMYYTYACVCNTYVNKVQTLNINFNKLR